MLNWSPAVVPIGSPPSMNSGSGPATTLKRIVAFQAEHLQRFVVAPRHRAIDDAVVAVVDLDGLGGHHDRGR